MATGIGTFLLNFSPYVRMTQTFLIVPFLAHEIIDL